MAQKNENKILKFLESKKNRSRLYTVLFFVIFGVFFIVNNSGNEPEKGPYPPNYVPGQNNAAVKEIAPNFSLNSIEGEKISLADYKGKIVLVDFWATWCGPCRKGVPDLVDLKNKYGDKGFEVIGISVDRSNTISQVKPFAKEFNINYPVVYTDEQTPGKFGGIQYIPTSFVINQEGYIVSKHVGYVEKEQYIKEIEELLKN